MPHCTADGDQAPLRTADHAHWPVPEDRGSPRTSASTPRIRRRTTSGRGAGGGSSAAGALVLLHGGHAGPSGPGALHTKLHACATYRVDSQPWTDRVRPAGIAVSSPPDIAHTHSPAGHTTGRTTEVGQVAFRIAEDGLGGHGLRVPLQRVAGVGRQRPHVTAGTRQVPAHRPGQWSPVWATWNGLDKPHGRGIPARDRRRYVVRTTDAGR